MRKLFKITAYMVTLLISLTSCLSTGVTSRTGTVEIPDTTDEAISKIFAHEKKGEYLYSFEAVNYGDIRCNVKIYDDKYMKVTYPQTGKSFYYYYKFCGDYLEYSKRYGVFGYAVDITTDNVEEIVFQNIFFGGYKFKSISDQMQNDRRYLGGHIIWNEYPASRQPESYHFLEFFQERGKKLSSTADEAGNKRDLAGTLYYSLNAKPAWTVSWKTTVTEKNTSKGENE